MVPIKDDIPNDRVPVVTLALIAANVLVFLIAGADAAREHGLVPGDVEPWAFLTSMFVHVGWLHLLGNVLFLWLFGPNVEDACGRVRFLALYLVGGVVAAAAQVAVDPGSTAPLAGASGAVATIMGAYLRLYPWARILAIVFMVLFFTIVEIPVVAMLALWAAVQALLAVLDPGSVAVAAHLAGFVLGVAVARIVATDVKTPESVLARGRAVTP
ncbi:MAG TPA: rhomboid family intramembrane serine protease [Capillimicrobium sp.]|nr:rhomboid family intramembrane serine protease [Capillimicrobium sp.]